MIEIIQYTAKDNRVPFEEWLKSLSDKQAKAKVFTRLNRLQAGNFGDHKSVRNGIHELRLHHGAGYRVYYGMEGKQLVILLVGGVKDSQDRDIEQALLFWNDWKNRKGTK